MKRPITRSRTGLLLTAAGACYLLLPLNAARTCLGMECLEFLIASVPVAVLSVPWSAPAQWLPPDPAVLEEELRRGQLLHSSYWPRYAFVSAGFLLNMFLLGLAFEWVWSRRPGRGRREEATGEDPT